MKEYNQVIQIQMSPEDLKNMITDITQNVVNQFKKAESHKDLPEWLTQTEIAKLYGVSRQTVSNWEKDGKLKREDIGGIPKFSKKQVLAIKR